jgi:hypothetical protein
MYHALTRSFSATGRQQKLAQALLVKLLQERMAGEIEA